MPTAPLPHTGVNVHQQKALLRSQLLGARGRLSAEERREAGRLIRDSVLSLPELGMAGTVAVYYSIGFEPETRGLVFGLWKRGTYVVLPVLRGDGDLDWASFEGPESMVKGPRGLLEPGEGGGGGGWRRWRGRMRCWCRRWRWTGPGTGWGAAVAALTVP